MATDWKAEYEIEVRLSQEFSKRAQRAERLLLEARQYVADAGSDEDAETQKHSMALLADIDAATGRMSGR